MPRCWVKKKTPYKKKKLKKKKSDNKMIKYPHMMCTLSQNIKFR